MEKRIVSNNTKPNSVLVELWVKFRTSKWFIITFVVFITSWILLNHVNLIDNSELTHLNLILSIEATLSSVLTLMYLNRIQERDHRKDKQDTVRITKILDKLEKMDTKLDD